ncbi:MAG TPA: hypothetical protein VJ385_21065 [Fibrobacteria bacterium]|nr:hypothetical protein [Fibrobacteria bacterium]
MGPMRLSPFLRAPALVFLLALLTGPALAPARAGEVLGDDFNEEESHDYNGMPKLRLALETGYSQWMYNPDSLTPDYDEYLNTLESGWNFSAEAAWFPWPKGGVGVNWIWFLSKAQRADLKIVKNSNSLHSMRDRVSVVYFGPTFLSRLQCGRFGLLVGGFGAGPLLMNYTWTDNGLDNVVKATTYAAVANIGWDYSFYRLVSFGVNARVLLSNLREYTYNGKKVTLKQPDDPHYWVNISMTRFELNAGIRFGL